MAHPNIELAVGQMLVFGWHEDPDRWSAIPAHAEAVINELHAGGLIVMGRNAAPPKEMRERLDEFQRMAIESSGARLFISVDQEGGRVNRLGPPNYTHQPSMRELGGSPAGTVRDGAAIVGKELREAGLNWNFAPVLDVDNNPDNPVIGDRSFSPDPEVCATMGVQAIAGYQEDAGIFACGKHFPGHGDTNVDSHFGLPRIYHDRTRLDSVELVPFKAAIAAGVKAIMTSHIVFSGIDPDLPATLSHRVLTGLLRDELGFEGLIVTDCLEMKGVADGWGSAEAAVMAVEAGADLLLCCHTLETQREIRDSLVHAVQSGRISMDRIEASLGRIYTCKTQWMAP